ncbi:hypothetical protein B566_EDAN017264 [Ephemera danica]|nr:hypothetical protein B566_EDAN017264 [Ephemera danica]
MNQQLLYAMYPGWACRLLDQELSLQSRAKNRIPCCIAHMGIGFHDKVVEDHNDMEPANPLGSARTKHKTLACYYTIGNLSPEVRSRLDNIYLAMLEII